MKKIRYIIEHGFLLAFHGFCSLLPRHIASSMFGSLASFIAPSMGMNKKAVRHIDMALKTGRVESERIAEDMWLHLGRMMAEFPHLKDIAENDIIFKGGEHIEEMRDDGQCGILFGGHLGNWEVIPHALIHHYNFKAHPVYRAPNNPYVDKRLDTYRNPNDELKTYSKSRQGMIGMVKALKKGDHLGMLVDQKYNEGVDAPFFGMTARTGTAFIELSQKYDCPLVPIRCIRDGEQFIIEVLPPIHTKNREVMDILDECHNLLENWIREYPEQWLWMHRRWKDEDVKNDT